MALILPLTRLRRRPIPLLLLSGAHTLEKEIIFKYLLSVEPTLRIHRIGLQKWYYPEDQHPYHTASEGTTRDIRRVFRHDAADLIVLEASEDFRVRDYLRLLLPLVPESEARVQGVLSLVDSKDLLQMAVRVQLPNQTPYTIVPQIQHLVNQIECCDLLLVRSWNKMARSQKELSKHFLRILQPRAEIIPRISRPLAESLLHQRWFEREFTTRSSSCAQLLSVCGPGETNIEIRPIPNSLIYRRNVPFHYGKLLNILKQFPTGILRSTGTVWLNTKVQCELILDQLRGHFVSLTLPTESISDKAKMQTEIVFIGGGEEHGSLIERLDSCLVSPLDPVLLGKRSGLKLVYSLA